MIPWESPFDSYFWLAALEIDASRIRAQDEYPIEDPAQAWNALTVGGYTDLIDLTEEGYENWLPLSSAGALSPHSRTSAAWPQGQAPLKPENVMEAGNRGINPARTEVLTFKGTSKNSSLRRALVIDTDNWLSRLTFSAILSPPSCLTAPAGAWRADSGIMRPPLAPRSQDGGCCRRGSEARS